MKKLSFLSSLFLVSFCFSQSTVLHNLNHSRLMSQVVNKIGVEELVDNEYEGSPFLEKQFLPSTIKGEKGTYLLRYNIYNDEVILKQGDQYFKIPKEGVDYISINNKYVLRAINGSYYIQSSAEKNNFTVVRKEEVRFTSAKNAQNAYEQNKPARFSSAKPDYFLYNAQTKLFIPLKADGIKKAFPAKETELASFFKKNKLKDTEDYDLLLEILAK